MRATSQVRNRFPVGSRICVNMDDSPQRALRASAAFFS
jgi:hypothetical protein